jgi:hypothetical protein
MTLQLNWVCSCWTVTRGPHFCRTGETCSAETIRELGSGVDTVYLGKLFPRWLCTVPM